MTSLGDRRRRAAALPQAERRFYTRRVRNCLSTYVCLWEWEIASESAHRVQLQRSDLCQGHLRTRPLPIPLL